MTSQPERRQGGQRPILGDVGRRIRAARQERGLSLAKLGGEDLSRSFLNQVELGRSRISLRALAIVAERLDLPISYFLDEGEGPARDVGLVLDSAESALVQGHPGAALKLLTDLPAGGEEEVRRLALAGQAQTAGGHDDEAITSFERAASLAAEAGDRWAEANARARLASVLYKRNSYDESLRQARLAAQIVPDGDKDPLLLGRILVLIGHLLYIRGEPRTATDYYERARVLFGSIGDLQALGSLYSGLSLAYQAQGNLARAAHYSTLGLGVFKARHDAREIAREGNNLAVRYLEMDRPELALELAQEAAAQARAAEDPAVEAIALGTMAGALLRLGRNDDAESQAEASLRAAPEDALRARAHAWIVLGEVAAGRGDRRATDAYFERALEGLETEGHTALFADAAVTYSRLLRERGDVERALDLALRAADIRRGLRAAAVDTDA